MSNKIVPGVYRSVIDDVIANIKSEFDEYGVGEDVLADLQSKWEAKVIQSHVAEFEPSPAPPQSAPPTHPSVPPHPSYPPHPMHMHNPHYPPHAYNLAPPPGPPIPVPTPVHVKSEPVEQRYLLNQQTHPYTLPPLAGPQIARPNGTSPYPSASSVPQARPSSTGPAPPAPTARYPNGQAQQPTPPQSSAPTPPTPAARIPQVDGPSSSSSGSPSPPPSQSYAPRPMHPSLPQPAGSDTANGGARDDELINSDLDDSDSDNERDTGVSGGADSDIVFCTYDKVARVKNKWKCILKDGMIHVNGRDYLFAKCTGEFEW
ncbi:hypothetical protein QCA50_003897 [Cerrena zonata]|uniref:Transcription initiation factor IIA large subunit n=1 Tax=Cerrena zonata TaxID=2478898 RepID=A0AAW0GHV1_9APHY